jgi:hypothetical protein
MVRIKKQSAAKFQKSLSSTGGALNADASLRYRFAPLPAGVAAAFDHEANEIIMPPINSIYLTEEEAIKLRAFDGHERKHHHLDDGNVLKRFMENKPKKLIEKGYRHLSDARIEANTNFRERGTDQDIAVYRKKEFDKLMKDKEAFWAQDPFGFLWAAMQYKWCGVGNIPIPPKYMPYFDTAWTILNDGRFKKACQQKKEGSQASVDLAKEIVNAWDIEDPPDSEQSNDENDKDSSSKDSGQGDGEPSSPKEGEGKPSKEETISEKYENIDTDFEIDPESLGHDIAEIGAKQKKDHPHDGRPYVPYTAEDQIIIAPKNPIRYEGLESAIESQSKLARKRMARMLLAESLARTETHKRSGKLDRRSYVRVAQGSERAYKRVYKTKTMTSAVQIIVDCSGSMSGRINLCANLSTLFAKIFDPLQIPFEILGYGCTHARANIDSLKNQGYTRVDGNVTIIFKEFHEKFSAVKHRLGSMPSSAIYGTLDADTIYWGASRLLKVQADRRIQLVLLDGSPESVSYGDSGLYRETLKKVNGLVLTTGIEQVAIGIMTEAPKQFFKNWIICNDMSDFIKTGIDTLGKKLTIRRR